MATPKPESEPEATFEPDVAPEPEAGEVEDVAILVPTAVAIVVTLTAVLCLSFKTQRLWWKNRLRLPATQHQTGRISPCVDEREAQKPLPGHVQLDKTLDLDCEPPSLARQCLVGSSGLGTVREFKEFSNSPKGLLGVMLPAAVSLALCPVTLYLYRPLMILFWPPDGVPLGDDADAVVNSIVYSFLIPSGLIYATTFGFAFQEVASKRGLLESKLSSFGELVRMICTQVVHSKGVGVRAKCTLMRCLTSHVLMYMRKLTGQEEKNGSFDAALVEVLDVLQQTGHSTPSSMSSALSISSWSLSPAAAYRPVARASSPRCCGSRRHLTSSVSALKHLLIQMEDMQKCIRSSDVRPLNVLQWLFMEALAFTAYFGILLLRAQSARLELIVCFLTVFSISTFSYVLADMDCPFHGIFRVNLNVLLEILDYLETQCLAVQKPETKDRALAAGTE